MYFAGWSVVSLTSPLEIHQGIPRDTVSNFSQTRRSHLHLRCEAHREFALRRGSKLSVWHVEGTNDTILFGLHNILQRHRTSSARNRVRALIRFRLSTSHRTTVQYTTQYQDPPVADHWEQVLRKAGHIICVQLEERKKLMMMWTLRSLRMFKNVRSQLRRSFWNSSRLRETTTEILGLLKSFIQMCVISGHICGTMA